MDPSALIFVALAVAWAVYLIPKALEHHGESDRARTVERFSDRMRVLARREPVSRRTARLVGPEAAAADAADVVDRTASRPAPEPVAPEPLTPAQLRAHRRAAARAAKRRLRVVTLILLANVVVAALAAFSVIAWVWCAVPVAVLVAWLVACRLMVKRERAAVRPQRRLPVDPAAQPAVEPASTDDTTTVAAVTDTPFDGEVAESAASAEDPVGEPEVAKDPGSWDPVPVTLPTYVTKAVAPRSVSTIDLDSTGVWSSGRNESDSALARDADAAHAADRQNKSSSAASRRKASGS